MKTASDDIVDRLLTLIHDEYGGDSLETMRDPIATLLKAMDEIEALRGVGGWQTSRPPVGKIAVLFLAPGVAAVGEVLGFREDGGIRYRVASSRQPQNGRISDGELLSWCELPEAAK